MFPLPHQQRPVFSPCAAKKLRYDIWGIDSLVANACESNGTPGCILLSGDLAALVADEFVLEPGEPFDIVGKSEPIQTFLLRPERQPLKELS